MRGTGGAVINSSRLTAAGFSVGQRGNSVVDGVGRQRGIEVIRCFLEEIHFLPSAGSVRALGCVQRSLADPVIVFG